MKLRKLSIERIPGIDRPFELEQLGDGLNLIVGPNGIGKSRLCAAVRALLWSELGIKDGGLAASAVFEHQNEAWRVGRDGSRYGWQRDGIDADRPALPGERLEPCFFLGLRDLLDDSDRAGRDLANEIRRQMSGGFDLDAVTRRLEGAVTARIGTKESKALSVAESEIRKAERSQIEVERQEQELQSLERRADRAKKALQRLPHYDRAISLQAMRRDHAQWLGELADLPAELANLDGKEIERLERLEETLGEKRGDRDEANGVLEKSLADARDTRLTEPLDPTLLDTWRQRAEKLGELERRLEQAREDAEAVRATASEARKALGSHIDTDSGLTIDDDIDLFAFLRASHQIAAERMALQERLNLLAAGEFSEDDARRLELFKRGVESLREWLHAPDPSEIARAMTLWPSRAHYFIAAVMFIAIGLGAMFLWPTFRFSIIGVGLGIGLAVAGALSRLRQASKSNALHRRPTAEQRFPQAIDPPTDWSAEAVTERLYQLDDELAQLAASEKGSLYRAADRAQLNQKIGTLDKQDAGLEDRRRKLADRLGLGSILQPDADMVDTVRALGASRAARAAAQSATSRVNELEGQQKKLLDSIAAFLTALSERTSSDAAAARAGVDSLMERNRTLRRAQEDASREKKRCDRLDDEIKTLEDAKAELFRVVGVEADDRSALIRRLELLGRYRKLCSDRDDLATNIKRADGELNAAGEGRLAGLDLVGLNEEKIELEEESQHLENLNRKIGEINQSARSAREGHVLEDAIAKRNAVLRELGDRRDEALAAAAGKFLIDRVRIDHETNQMPRVLERAQHHFGAFTHERYRLKVSPSDGGSFVAIDAKSGGLGLSPDKLSDGTRAQLILAARLAFAEEVEQGADLPLFLDEALDHSDPERFHSIARSLARMVEDGGRQVFYLSNDPTDVDRFRAAFNAEGCDQLNTIDLGEVRHQVARVDGPEALRVAPLAPVPSPVGQNAESYGVALGVAPFDPNRDSRSQHLYYVLRDDLSLLHELLLARIETVGQCLNLLKGGSALAKEVAGQSEVGAQLEPRMELLDIFCLAWREGRGRKVGRLELEQSGAISETYLDAVVAVAAELDGNAGRLLTSLRERKDPRLSGFRSKSTAALERFFVEGGHVDDRPILGEAQLLARAIDTPAAHQLSANVAAELLHQWWSLSQCACEGSQT